MIPAKMIRAATVVGAVALAACADDRPAERSGYSMAEDSLHAPTAQDSAMAGSRPRPIPAEPVPFQPTGESRPSAMAADTAARRAPQDTVSGADRRMPLPEEPRSAPP